MTGEQRVGDRRDDRAVVAEDAGEQLLFRRQLAAQVGADLGPHRLRAPGGALELSQGLRQGRHPCLCLQPAFGVDRRLAAGAGGGDRLAVERVGDVAAGEDARHAGAGRRLFDQHVAGRRSSAAGRAKSCGVRLVADGDEEPLGREAPISRRSRVSRSRRPRTPSSRLPRTSTTSRVPGRRSSGWPERALLHDLRGAELARGGG